MSDDLITRSNGYFNVLAVHRDDVAQALATHGPAELRTVDGDPGDDAMSLASQLGDEEMGYLARRLGDRMMEGADYYEAICDLATPMIEFPSQEDA